MTVWRCVRQRSGPLVKECRYWLPRFSAEDTAEDHRLKQKIKTAAKTAVNRHPADRLELRLAALGWDASHHTLTFDDAHLPRNFKGVRAALAAFLKRSQRWRAGLGKSPALPYIYAIEGLHSRYHIHFACGDDDLTPAEIAHLWSAGLVDNQPVLLASGGYRRLAEYLTKERADGEIIPVGRHPWSCSRTLNAMIQPAERWRDDTGEIVIPGSAIWSRTDGSGNSFGEYRYASWIEDDGSKECRRIKNRIEYGRIKHGKRDQGQKRVSGVPDVPPEDGAESDGGDQSGAPAGVVPTVQA